MDKPQTPAAWVGLTDDEWQTVDNATRWEIIDSKEYARYIAAYNFSYSVYAMLDVIFMPLVEWLNKFIGGEDG
jgi:protein associated with RNAse G/E